MKKLSIIAIIFAFTLAGCAQIRDQDSAPVTNNLNDGQDQISEDMIDRINGEDFIRLTSPQAGQVLKTPFLVAGEADLPGDTVYVDVKNKAGDILISEKTSIQAPAGESGPFGVFIRFQFQSTSEGFVEVYGKDDSGGKQNRYNVPVQFDLTSQANAEVGS